MKKHLLLLLGLGMILSTQAQKGHVAVEAKDAAGVEMNEPSYNGTIIGQPPVISSKDAAAIGSTIYDMQTNSTVVRRLDIHDDGTMSAVWTMGFNSDNGYDDRGTGYNYFDGSAWGAIPGARIESERTGWPQLLSVSKDIVIAHGPADGSLLMNQNSAFGADDWTETSITASPIPRLVWPRAAVGGPDGNTIHLIANTYDEYAGMIRTIVYYRSTDGGQTWDITGEVIDGADSTKYNLIRGDQYTIDARGNTIAIGIFSSLGDVQVLKSTDNGDTWTSLTVIDFPDQFEPFNSDEDFFDVDEDGIADSTSKNEGSGAVIIDSEGKVHVAAALWFGHYDGGNYYYPSLSDGIVYWNENMPEGEFSTDFIVAPSMVYLHNNLDTVVKMPDPNGNGEPDWAVDDPSTSFFGDYQLSLSSFPQFAIDEDDNIYMVYSTVMEEYYKDDANPNLQHFRHIYCVGKYANGGWDEPVNLTLETGIDANTENICPMAARNIYNDELHVMWQNDSEPGISVDTDGDGDPPTTNTIIYNSFPRELILPAVGIKNAKKNNTTSSFAYPNPVKDILHLDIKQGADVKIYDVTGRNMLHIKQASSSQTIDMSSYENGTYLIQVADQHGVETQKVLKQ